MVGTPITRILFTLTNSLQTPHTLALALEAISGLPAVLCVNLLCVNLIVVVYQPALLWDNISINSLAAACVNTPNHETTCSNIKVEVSLPRSRVIDLAKALL